MEILTIIVSSVAALAIIISVIIQVLKQISFLDKIPTELMVIVLSLILTPVGTKIYFNYIDMPVTSTVVIGSVILGFFVAFVSMFGWEKLTSIVSQFKVDPKDLLKSENTEE